MSATLFDAERSPLAFPVGAPLGEQWEYVTFLIHIGHHKTGSTWLQRYFFQEALGFAPLRFSGPRRVHHDFIFPTPLTFDAGRIRESYTPQIEAATAQQLIPVLSLERLAGNPHSGGYDSILIANRLAETFPHAKILLVIREQTSMVISSYKQFIRAGGSASLAVYVNPAETFRTRWHLFSLDFFKYDALIAYYQQLFGGDNLLVLPYEWFNSQPAAYLNQIMRFVAHPTPAEALEQAVPALAHRANQATPAFELWAQRQLRPLFGQATFLNPKPLWPSAWLENGLLAAGRTVSHRLGWVNRQMEAHLAQQAQAYTEDYYADSNAETTRLTGLDLHQWGYQMPKNLSVNSV